MVRLGLAFRVGDTVGEVLAQLRDGGLGLLGFGPELGELPFEAARILDGFRRQKQPRPFRLGRGENSGGTFGALYGRDGR